MKQTLFTDEAMELLGPSYNRPDGCVDEIPVDRPIDPPTPAEVRRWLRSKRCTLWQTFILDKRGLEMAADWFCDAFEEFYAWRDTDA